MGVIGKNNTTGVGGATITTSGPQRLIKLSSLLYTPAQDEIVTTFGFIAASPAGGVMEIGVADVTDGVSGAPLIGSEQVTADFAGSNNEASASGTYSLTAGRTYAVQFRAVSDVTTNVGYVAAGTSNSSLTSASAFASTWTDSANDDSQWSVYALTEAAGPSGPTLSSVPATAYPGETITITGSGLTGASADLGGETAAVTVNSDTEIEVTIAQGDMPFGTDTLTVTTAGGSATDDIELIVEPGTGGYVDVVDPAVADTSSLAYQFEAAGGDPVATGDQCQWRYTGTPGDPTSMTVQADTLVSALDAEGDVDVRFWDATDSTWGSWTELSASATDTTPDQFDLGANVTGAEPGATVQRTFVLAGIDAGETVTVTATGSATRSPATAQVGDTITVELTAGAFEAVVSGGVTINGVSDSFSVTSRAAVLPTQDVVLPDLNLGETDAVSIDLDNYFSGASSYTLTGLPAGSGLSFSGSVLSGNVNKDDIADSPYTLTATAFSADGSINDAFSVTVVDDIAPVISVFGLTTLDTTPNLSGSAGDAVSLTLDVEGVDVVYSRQYSITPSNGNWNQLSDELALGQYTLTLNGQDAAGNAAVERVATLRVVNELKKARGMRRMGAKMGMGI